jgi:hypothetical protein
MYDCHAGSRPSLARVDEWVSLYIVGVANSLSSTFCECTAVNIDTVLVCRKPVDVGSLLRFKSHVVDVVYKPVQHKAGSGQHGAPVEEAHIAVEVAAVISHPEQRDTTHTNTFR